MTQQIVQTPIVDAPVVDGGVEDRWAAWQARGAENSRATRRNLFVLGGILLISAIAISVLF